MSAVWHQPDWVEDLDWTNAKADSGQVIGTMSKFPCKLDALSETEDLREHGDGVE